MCEAQDFRDYSKRIHFYTLALTVSEQLIVVKWKSFRRVRVTQDEFQLSIGE